ncbi:MAG: hypothetical protein QM630_00650 [Microbacterium sp.]
MKLSKSAIGATVFLASIASGAGIASAAQTEPHSATQPTASGAVDISAVRGEAMEWADANASFTPLVDSAGLVDQDDAAAAIADGLANVLAEPEATGHPEAALYSYTNSAYGEIDDDGSVTLTFVDTPVWLFTVRLDAPIKSVAQGGYGFGTQTGGDDECTYYYIVDAANGEFLTSGQHCAVIDNTGATAPPEGK